MATGQGKRKPTEEANSAYLRMRSEHRAKLADMVIGIKDEDYADKTAGLLHGPNIRKNNGLKVYIPLWDNLPPPNARETITVQLEAGTGRFDNVAEHEFTMGADGKFPETFPYEMLIEINRLPDIADCQLRYIHRSYQGNDVISTVTPVICDRVRPNNDMIPAAPVFAGDFLDDTNLPAGGTLTVTIAGYPDWDPSDQMAIYLIDSWDIPDNPTATPPIWTGFAPSPGITDSTVTVQANAIRAFGDTKALITYAMRDTHSTRLHRTGSGCPDC